MLEPTIPKVTRSAIRNRSSFDLLVIPDAQTSEVLHSETEPGLYRIVSMRVNFGFAVVLAEPNVLTKLELPSTEDDEEEPSESDPTQQVENEEGAPNAEAGNEEESDDILQKPDRAGPPRLPADFYYEPEKVQAKPTTTDEKIFPMNTLSM